MRGVTVVLLALAATLVGCGSATQSASSRSSSASAFVGHRESYGALSVIVPFGWKIAHVRPPPCVGAKDTFYFSTMSHFEAAVGCIPIVPASRSFGTLTCLVGEANAPIPSTGKVSIPGGAAYRNGETMVVPGRNGATTLTVVGPNDVISEILASAQRTGRSC